MRHDTPNATAKKTTPATPRTTLRPRTALPRSCRKRAQALRHFGEVISRNDAWRGIPDSSAKDAVQIMIDVAAGEPEEEFLEAGVVRCRVVPQLGEGAARGQVALADDPDPVAQVFD